MFMSAAKKADLTLSTWLRSVALAAAIAPRIVVGQLPADVCEVL